MAELLLLLATYAVLYHIVSYPAIPTPDEICIYVAWSAFKCAILFTYFDLINDSNNDCNQKQKPQNHEINLRNFWLVNRMTAHTRLCWKILVLFKFCLCETKLNQREDANQ